MTAATRDRTTQGLAVGGASKAAWWTRALATRLSDHAEAKLDRLDLLPSASRLPWASFMSWVDATLVSAVVLAEAAEGTGPH